MARTSVKIEPVHSDGTVCDHDVKPSGMPSDPDSGCTGRTGYQAKCSEHGVIDGPRYLRLLVEPEAREHRDSHKTTPASDAR